MTFFIPPAVEITPHTHIEMTRKTTQGASREAGLLDELFRNTGATQPADLEDNRLQNALLNLFSSCRESDWDGYGAEPLSRDLLKCAYLFVSQLPNKFPTPEVGAEGDGHITFEWYTSPSQLLNVSVSATGKLHYAAIFPDGSSHYGTEALNGRFPVIVKALVEKVMNT